jgi:hypothetical protein
MMLECDDRGGYRIGMARRKKVKEIKSGMESERGIMGSGGEHEGEKTPKKINECPRALLTRSGRCPDFANSPGGWGRGGPRQCLG